MEEYKNSAIRSHIGRKARGMDQKIGQFMAWLAESSRVVFFGGAGVSTESGIPDFRSVDGLYNQKYDYPPETILSHTFFRHRTEEFFRFYWDKMIYEGAEPNKTHLALAGLERAGKLAAVVTQNIDGLHQKAGSRKVLELHGSILRNYCMKCGQFYSLEEMKEQAGMGEQGSVIPRCGCGGVIKPDVVLYEESLSDAVMSEAIGKIAEADMLIVGGTSLAVYPAAGLIRYYAGKRLVLVNMSETPYDSQADLVIHAGLGTVFGRILES